MLISAWVLVLCWEYWKHLSDITDILLICTLAWVNSSCNVIASVKKDGRNKKMQLFPYIQSFKARSLLSMLHFLGDSQCVACLSFVPPVPRGWRHHHRHHSYQFHVGLQQVWWQIVFSDVPPHCWTCSVQEAAKESLHARGVLESCGSQGKWASNVHSVSFLQSTNWICYHLQVNWGAGTWMGVAAK